MPQDPAATLSALLRSSSIEDHDEILKAANAAIKANKNDLGHQHTRVVALLKLDRFDDALRSIAEGGDSLDKACVLEKAYALYKTGKLDEATSVLETSDNTDRGFQHVAAQVAYRAERFEQAGQIYQQILSGDAGPEESDLKINLKAAVAQAEWTGAAVSRPLEDQDQLDAFELSYNEACSYIARGAFTQASELLQRAVKVCDASDDLSEEDRQAEMRPILAQQAYVYARLGKTKEALDLLNSIGSADESEADINLVVDSNRIALESTPTNPFLVQRKAASLEALTRKAKLFQVQSDLLTQNSLITDLAAHKINGVQGRTKAALLKEQHPATQSSLVNLSVINAAAEVHGKTGKALARAVQDLSRKRANEVGLVLTVIQIQLQHGHSAPALSTLESFLSRLEGEEDAQTKDVRFSPGLVALLVSLFREQGRTASAKNELVKASKHWLSNPDTAATSLLREAGIELLKSSNAEDLALAGAAFEKLFEQHQGSHIAAAGLVAALAPTDPSKVEKHAADLPAVDDLVQDIDVEALLDAGVAAAPKSTLARKRAAPGSDADKKTTAKRKKRKLPKNYEEGKTPDPERWLPLRDRSSYRPKGKKGRKKAAESTQGGVVKEEETLELVGGGGVKVEKAASGGNTSSKKKKKGKK